MSPCFLTLSNILVSKISFHQIRKASPVTQVVLGVGMDTPGTALTVIADLKTAPEVDK
jgi:hypothetical protein